MRRMSFFLTTKQVRNRTKTVTRRIGWWDLEPGEHVGAFVKCRGLKKGESAEWIDELRTVSATPEPLCAITKEDVVKEGFPNMSVEEFIAFFCKTHKGATPQTTVNRIEFEYVLPPHLNAS